MKGKEEQGKKGRGFLLPTLSLLILFICFRIDLVCVLATTGNTRNGYLCMLIDSKVLTQLLLTHLRKTEYADWLRSMFYCYLLTFGKLTRWE